MCIGFYGDFELYTCHYQIDRFAVLNHKKKAYTLSDGQGLSLLIEPNGSKGWRFRYRFAGKARLMSLGTYDLVSLAEARSKRDVARKQVADGTDPAEVKKG